MSDLKNKIEAILFASGKGVSEDDLAKYCDSTPRKILNQVNALEEEFIKRDGSLIITKHNNKWKMTVRARYASDIQHIASETEFSGPILKTLAIIAFKSPVLQADIIAMRGQGAYDHVKALVKEKFITKEEEGRSYILKITDKFYNYFDVQGDEEIREVFEKLKKQQQKITELEIIEIAKSQEEDEKKIQQHMLGNLEIVETKPITREKTLEEKQKEESFLSRIDEQLQEASKRISSHELPAKSVNEEKAEEETNNINTASENKKEELNEAVEKKDSTNYLEEIELFAEKNTKKKTNNSDDDEDFI
jgi:segregation and condensation protein B